MRESARGKGESTHHLDWVTLEAVALGEQIAVAFKCQDDGDLRLA